MTKIRERQLVHGTPVQLLRAQTEAVAYKPTLARPSARNSRYGIGGGRCSECVSHRQELPTSPSYCCCCQPESEFDPASLLRSHAGHFFCVFFLIIRKKYSIKMFLAAEAILFPAYICSNGGKTRLTENGVPPEPNLWCKLNTSD